MEQEKNLQQQIQQKPSIDELIKKLETGVTGIVIDPKTKLPSNGLEYPNSLEIEIKPLTSREERMLLTLSTIKNTKVYTKKLFDILNGRLVFHFSDEEEKQKYGNSFSINDLVFQDFETILFLIYRASYPNNHEVDVEALCPVCQRLEQEENLFITNKEGKKVKVKPAKIGIEIDLNNDININTFYEEFGENTPYPVEITLPVKKEFSFKIGMIKMKYLWDIILNSEISEEEKQIKLFNAFYAYGIKEINGNSYSPQDILKFFFESEGLVSEDSNFILKIIEKFTNIKMSPIEKHNLVCKHGHEIETLTITDFISNLFFR